MTGIFFAHPHTLLGQVDNILEKIGPKQFFKSSNQEVKKAREGLPAYFFTLILKKSTGRDWWLAQYDQVDRTYPDFDFISFDENPLNFKLESVELTGVYPHFKSFEEVLSVIYKKKKKYGPNPVNFSLLIFVNHENSVRWIEQLLMTINDPVPFISIWAIHLSFMSNSLEIQKVIAHRLAPFPIQRVEVDTNDPEIHIPQPLPSYVEQSKDGENTYITFNKAFMDKLNSVRRSNNNSI